MDDLYAICISRKKGVFTPWQKQLIINKLKSFGLEISDQVRTDNINRIFLSGSRALDAEEKKIFINFLTNDYGIMEVEIF